MREVWIYKRQTVKGWRVGWYQSGKHKTKALPTKALAEHYRQMKYAQLNSDVFPGIATVDWAQMREKLGLGGFKFHDLRKTFGSVFAQKGVSTAVTQRLLENSSPDLTNKVYTNVDPVLRRAADLIPAGDWL